MPRSHERNLQIPRQPSAQNARLARPGDVDNIRAECPHTCFEEFLVAQEGGIEDEILLQTKGTGAAAGNLERRQLPQLLLAYRAIPLARMQTKKRQASSLRKGFKVPAGVGHPVDLVKRIGKVRHPWGRRAHKQSVSARCRSKKT